MDKPDFVRLPEPYRGWYLDRVWGVISVGDVTKNEPTWRLFAGVPAEGWSFNYAFKNPGWNRLPFEPSWLFDNAQHVADVSEAVARAEAEDRKLSDAEEYYPQWHIERAAAHGHAAATVASWLASDKLCFGEAPAHPPSLNAIAADYYAFYEKLHAPEIPRGGGAHSVIPKRMGEP
jgi:hypothetical protein